jgi:uncharacterized membrane protein YdjX (TVP38/TMEM64 family)
VAAYELGLHVGREIIRRLISASSLQMADRMMAKYGSLAIVIGRWLPGVPCDPVSYAAGFSQKSFLSFVILSAVGLLPANLLTAYLGSRAAGDVPTRGWVAFLLLIGVGAFVWYRTRRDEGKYG